MSRNSNQYSEQERAQASDFENIDNDDYEERMKRSFDQQKQAFGNQNQQQQQKWERGQKPQYLQEIDEEEAKKKWGDKIFTLTGKTKAEQDQYPDELLEQVRQENLKGKLNYYSKIKQMDKVQMKSKEYVRKDDKSQQDIPIDGDFVQGSTVYMRNCATCHSLETNTQARKTTGPALGLIYGKRAGSDQYYQDYTEQLIDTKIIWNARSLFPFLKNPQTYIKGNRCGSQIESEEERSDIIKFMKMYSKNLAKNMRLKANKIYGKQYVDVQLQTEKQIDDEVQKRIRQGQ